MRLKKDLFSQLLGVGAGPASPSGEEGVEPAPAARVPATCTAQLAFSTPREEWSRASGSLLRRERHREATSDSTNGCWPHDLSSPEDSRVTPQ